MATLALATVPSVPARGGEWGAEIRVLSGPGVTSTVVVRARPGVRLEDRTPGALPTAGRHGPTSSGTAFAGEVTLLLGGLIAPRQATIEVADPLITTVRLFPEETGTSVTVFVRQPVTYTISRPSAAGEVRIELRGRVRPVTVVGDDLRGRLRLVRPRPTDDGEVAVDAESLAYDQQANLLVARGGVTLTHGDTTLTADEVIYDRRNATVEARGNVVLTDPEAALEGEFAHLLLDDESGWVDDASLELRPSRYRLTAGRLEKLGGPRYSVANGIFTTCECGGLERPSWSIAGRQTDVRLQGAGVVRGLTFRVKDTPVLYLPYFVFPANTERQSGLLLPRVGYSNRRGVQYEQPFYWAINKSMDATLALDVETSARVGAVGEYRYMLSRRTRGSFTAAYVNEAIRGRPLGTETGEEDADIPEDRFAVAGRHVQPAYKGSNFYLDVFAVGDDEFLREIDSFAFDAGHDIALRSTRLTTTRAGVLRTWRAGLARVETAYRQDLVDPQEVTPQPLPRLEAEHSHPLLGDRLVGRLAGEAVHFQREEGFDGVRGELAPEVFLPVQVGRVLHGSLTGRVRGLAYHLTDRQQVALVVPDAGVVVDEDFERFRAVPAAVPRLDTNLVRGLAEVHGRVGTGVERTFDFPHLGLDRLRHTIEPEVQYLHVPAVSSPRDERALRDCRTVVVGGRARLAPGERPGINCGATLFTAGYLFDERDAINRRSLLSYGLTMRLLGRPAPGTTGEATLAPEAPGEVGAGPPLAQGLPADVLPVSDAPDGREAVRRPARELARASILHGYDVSRTLVGDRHESDLDLGLRLTPLDYFGLVYNTTLDVSDLGVRGLVVGAALREPRWTPPDVVRNLQSATSLSLSYRFIQEDVNEDVGPLEALLLNSAGVNELDGALYLRLGRYLGFTFLSRYSFDTAQVVGDDGAPIFRADGTPDVLGPHFLERDYFLRVISRCNCWVLEAGVQDKFNPDERLFRVQFTLVGLGSFGRGAADRNIVGFAPLPELRPVGAGRPRSGVYRP